MKALIGILGCVAGILFYCVAPAAGIAFAMLCIPVGDGGPGTGKLAGA